MVIENSSRIFILLLLTLVSNITIGKISWLKVMKQSCFAMVNRQNQGAMLLICKTLHFSEQLVANSKSLGYTLHKIVTES